MSYLGTRDYGLEVSRGRIAGVTVIEKFGHAPAGVQTTATDIWILADATPTQQIYIAPTAARVHAIVSTSTSDASAGVGARTVRVSGLTDWDTAEVTETVTMNGTTPVNTSNSYVIINRIKVLTSGTTSINVGTITATAATDSTISAVIAVGYGQTQQCIVGIPSTQSLYLISLSGSINDNAAQSRLDMKLMVNESPNVSPLNVLFITKHEMAIQNSGNSFVQMMFDIPYKVTGPAIVKLQGVASAADIDAYGKFTGYLITN